MINRSDDDLFSVLRCYELTTGCCQTTRAFGTQTCCSVGGRCFTEYDVVLELICHLFSHCLGGSCPRSAYELVTHITFNYIASASQASIAEVETEDPIKTWQLFVLYIAVFAALEVSA